MNQANCHGVSLERSVCLLKNTTFWQKQGFSSKQTDTGTQTNTDKSSVQVLGPSPAGGGWYRGGAGSGLLEAVHHGEGWCHIRYQRVTLAMLIIAIARRPAPGSCFVPADSSAPPRGTTSPAGSGVVVFFCFFLSLANTIVFCYVQNVLLVLGTMEEVHSIRGQVMAGYLSHKNGLIKKLL